jgi:hypothetical protein
LGISYVARHYLGHEGKYHVGFDIFVRDAEGNRHFQLLEKEAPILYGYGLVEPDQPKTPESAAVPAVNPPQVGGKNGLLSTKVLICGSMQDMLYVQKLLSAQRIRSIIQSSVIAGLFVVDADVEAAKQTIRIDKRATDVWEYSEKIAASFKKQESNNRHCRVRDDGPNAAREPEKG